MIGTILLKNFPSLFLSEKSLHHSLLSQAAAAQRGSAPSLGHMNWLASGAGASGLHWALPGARIPAPQSDPHHTPTPNLSFQIPDFIKHAAQQQLVAHQAAQLKVSFLP